MKVPSRVESHHMPITLSIRLPNTTSLYQNKQIGHSYVKWDDDKLYQFMNELCVNNFKTFLENLECNIKNDVNECIGLLCNFYQKAAHMMTKSIKNINNQKNNRSSFFDKECHQKKLALRKYLRKYKRNKTIENKNNYANFRKEYKSFISDKRQAYNNSKIQSILNNFKNSKLFWKEIRALQIKENKHNSIEINTFFIILNQFFKQIQRC